MRQQLPRLIQSGLLLLCLGGTSWAKLPAGHEPNSMSTSSDPTAPPSSADVLQSTDASSDSYKDVIQAVHTPHFSRTNHCAFSPDGQWVAYVVDNHADKVARDWRASGMPSTARGEVRVWNRATRRSVAVLPGAYSIRPSWSPDGKTLAFYADQGGETGMYLFQPATGTSHRAGKFVVRPNLAPGDEPQWLDNQRVLVPVIWSADLDMYPDKMATLPRVIKLSTNNLTSQTDPSTEDVLTPGIYHLGSDYTQKLARITDGQYASMSPSGRYLAESSRPDTDGGQRTSQLVITDLTTGNQVYTRTIGAQRAGSPLLWVSGSETLLFQDGNAVLSLSVAGDNRLQEVVHATLDDVALTDRPNQVVYLDNGSFYLFNPESRPLREEFVLPAGFQGTRLLADAHHRVWEPTPGHVLVLGPYSSRGGREYLRLPLNGRKPSHSQADIGRVQAEDVDPQTGFLLALVETPQQPRDLYLLNDHLSDKAAIGLRAADEAAPVRYRIKTLHSVYTTPDGETQNLDTAILLPGTETNGPFPAVVYIYGGARLSHERNAYPESNEPLPASFLLQRGYAVVLPDLPLSERQPVDPLPDLQRVLMPQLDLAIKDGYLDGARLALAGHSYGAYNVAGLLANNNRFKAGIAVSGTYDLPGLYGKFNPANLNGQQNYFERGQGRMGVSPWAGEPVNSSGVNDTATVGTGLEKYLTNSPYYLADKINTPMFLAAARQDESYEETGKLFNALRRNGKQVELRLYPTGAHRVGDWPADYALDAYEGMLDFLGRNLGVNAPPPVNYLQRPATR
jgi:dipeptidyl aminopeptidase/acylaminoacyl peptidase